MRYWLYNHYDFYNFINLTGLFFPILFSCFYLFKLSDDSIILIWFDYFFYHSFSSYLNDIVSYLFYYPDNTLTYTIIPKG